MSNVIGLYFHSYKDGHLRWQGRVDSQAEPDCYLVTLFSWVTSLENGQRVVTLADMGGWRFYERHEDWVASAEAQQRAATR